MNMPFNPNPSHGLVSSLIKFPTVIKSAKDYLESENYAGPETYMYSTPGDGDYVKCAIVAGWDYVTEVQKVTDAALAKLEAMK